MSSCRACKSGRPESANANTETVVPPTRHAKPVVDLRSSRSPAQSESTYPSRGEVAIAPSLTIVTKVCAMTHGQTPCIHITVSFAWIESNNVQRIDYQTLPSTTHKKRGGQKRETARERERERREINGRKVVRQWAFASSSPPQSRRHRHRHHHRRHRRPMDLCHRHRALYACREAAGAAALRAFPRRGWVPRPLRPHQTTRRAQRKRSQRSATPWGRRWKTSHPHPKRQHWTPSH